MQAIQRLIAKRQQDEPLSFDFFRRVVRVGYAPLLKLWGLKVVESRRSTDSEKLWAVKDDCDCPHLPFDRTIIIVEKTPLGFVVGSPYFAEGVPFPPIWYHRYRDLAEELSRAFTRCISAFIVASLYCYLTRRGWKDIRHNRWNGHEIFLDFPDPKEVTIAFNLQDDSPFWAFKIATRAGATCQLRKRKERPPMKYFRQVEKMLSLTLL
ncbi:MAG: hypothetical protein RQ862_03505 [Candidatus Caldarchaeales archaeon]|jgi:hypothetical protein|nr:hypothetical protein [Candidatus Caldarchaeales archaeon]